MNFARTPFAGPVGTPGSDARKKSNRVSRMFGGGGSKGKDAPKGEKKKKNAKIKPPKPSKKKKKEAAPPPPARQGTAAGQLSNDDRLAILMRAGQGEITMDQAIEEIAKAEATAKANAAAAK